VALTVSAIRDVSLDGGGQYGIQAYWAFPIIATVRQPYTYAKVEVRQGYYTSVQCVVNDDASWTDVGEFPYVGDQHTPILVSTYDAYYTVRVARRDTLCLEGCDQYSSPVLVQVWVGDAPTATPIIPGTPTNTPTNTPAIPTPTPTMTPVHTPTPIPIYKLWTIKEDGTYGIPMRIRP